MNNQPPTSNRQQNSNDQRPTLPTKRPFDLGERCLNFAEAVIRVVERLPNLPEANVARKQLAESGTSIGANVGEADEALTKADKRKSFVIARKESGEARYWLRLIQRRWDSRPIIQELIDEVRELICIMNTIINKLS